MTHDLDDAPTGRHEEIRVTPEMLRAGVDALCSCLKYADEEAACFAAFTAMVEVSPQLCNRRVVESGE